MHMKLAKSTGLIAAFLLSASVSATAAPLASHVGDSYQIILTKESEQKGSLGSSNSHDRDTIVERVVGLRADGIELEYDFPPSIKPEERVSNWQFPIRIFKPFAGETQLSDKSELETRIDNWLKTAKLTRAACGHWIFTWNAFRIECDPQSAIKMIEAFELPTANIRDGAPYQEAGAQGSGTLARKASGPDGTTFTITLPVDPDAVRRTRAESDVVVGEVMHKPVAIDAALSKRANETISGTVSITFETDSTGNVRRRTKITKLDIKNADGQSERETVTETLERRVIAHGK
jgi:hypothetical protein